MLSSFEIDIPELSLFTSAQFVKLALRERKQEQSKAGKQRVG